ncbi:ABC transporter substrate-binding protein [Halosolutus amylolyticus]|uniref:ABC transporter substrate-binding protein n=1 Tax=Halosolutus amylolyticus TaxID=2932267 RepID=A0ABD5PMH2_9EURY|nr:ABC transporter substrate-binding protein [Halosolutus amylolyticus]
MEDGGPPVTRRELVAGAGAAGASALAGCAERFWSQAENDGPEQVSLTIKSAPTDDDVVAAKILSQLRENFRAAGINTTHEPVAKADLYRDVLLQDDYDVFVLKHPGFDEYDAVRGLLHSRFVSERGWQNPFNFSDVTADEHLETQRRSGESERRETLRELFEYLETTAPYTVVAYPYRFGGCRRTLDVSRPPRSLLEYVDIMSREENAWVDDRPLEVGVYGEGLTQRLNPIVVDRNRIDGLLDLVYDPLVRRRDDEIVPWLADTIDWDETGLLEAEVRLRDGLVWHDGTDLDAADVAFTIEFLDDTSRGAIDGGVPAPRYRDQLTLVDDVTTVDTRTLRFTFGDTVRPVATRVFTVPVLPEHVWAERSTAVAERRTEALVTDNEDPIGSGLFAFEESTANTELVLAPFEDHVFRRRTVDRPDVFENFSQFDGIRFRIAPNPGSMVETLVDGGIDVTVSNVPPEHAEPIRTASNVETVVGHTDGFYMIGYNVQHPQLSNPHFRRILSRLIDREYAVMEYFDGMADPASTYSSLFGFADEGWEHDEEPTTPMFPGADGELSVPRVRSLFENVGYRYENDRLLE